MRKNIKQKNIENSEINVSRSTSNGITKNKKQKGYAILFTVVIVSAISVITAGLSNAAYKQLILSSLAKDSQLAFYEADTAGDCALYADLVEITTNQIFALGGSWSCGGLDLTVIPFTPAGSGYSIYPTQAVQDSSDPCFRITVTKNQKLTDPPVTNTQISAKGYNICNKSNLRTVEREIKITHEE